MGTTINWLEKLRMRHRFLRYRFRSERPSILFLLGLDLGACTVLDVGANRGIYSYYLSKKVGQTGRVISFEPIPKIAQYLMEVTEAFQLTNVTVVDQGLSTSCGTARVGPGGDILDGAAASNPQAVDAKLTTLDDYLEGAQRPPIKFIKCDVEGYEYQVFKGGEKTLLRDKPILLFECVHVQAMQGGLFRYLTGIEYEGFFYFVKPSDHENIFRRGSGIYVRASEFGNYEYVRTNTPIRMYIFASKGSETWQRLSAAVGTAHPP